MHHKNKSTDKTSCSVKRLMKRGCEFPFLIISLLSVLIVSSCVQQQQVQSGQEHESHSAHGEEAGHDDHGNSHDEAGTLSFTLYADKTELFVEFPSLVVGNGSAFAAHITSLDNFKPALEGKLTVIIKSTSGSATQSIIADGPSHPGIFRPVLTPEKTGIYLMNITYETQGTRDVFVIDPVRVYSNAHEANEALPEEGGGSLITYLKEQSWKTEFATEEIVPAEFRQIIKASGEVLPAQGDEQEVAAPSSGTVFFSVKHLLPGTEVSKGTTLLSLSGAGFSSSNIDLQYKEAKSEYEKARADFERGTALHKDTIISTKDFSDITARYEKAKASYDLISASYAQGGHSVVSPLNGYLKHVHVAEGQFVEAGTPLFAVAKNRHLLIRADVAQRYAEQMHFIKSASISNGYGTPFKTIEELDGEIVSTGKTLTRDHPWLPVFFRVLNKGDLVPGSFVDVNLMTGMIADALTIPVSALMEEHGLFRVFVQESGEAFEKREITVGGSDGRRILVLSGLYAGERIVTRGTRQMQLATASGAIPSAHGHAH